MELRDGNSKKGRTKAATKIILPRTIHIFSQNGVMMRYPIERRQ